MKIMEFLENVLLFFSFGRQANFNCARPYSPGKSMQFFPACKQAAPWRARYLLAKKQVSFQRKTHGQKLHGCNF